MKCQIVKVCELQLPRATRDPLKCPTVYSLRPKDTQFTLEYNREAAKCHFGEAKLQNIWLEK